MRGLLLAFVVALLVVTPASMASAANDSLVIATAQDMPSPGRDIDVNVDMDGGGVWYTDPVWIIGGVIALLVLALIIVLAARGSGTTIIKE